MTRFSSSIALIALFLVGCSETERGPQIEPTTDDVQTERTRELQTGLIQTTGPESGGPAVQLELNRIEVARAAGNAAEARLDGTPLASGERFARLELAFPVSPGDEGVASAQSLGSDLSVTIRRRKPVICDGSNCPQEWETITYDGNDIAGVLHVEQFTETGAGGHIVVEFQMTAFPITEFGNTLYCCSHDSKIAMDADFDQQGRLPYIPASPLPRSTACEWQTLADAEAQSPCPSSY